MATAHQLYPTSRTANMTDDQLRSVQRCALADSAETAHTTVYAGMDRADTVATAQRTVQDTQAALNRSAAARFSATRGESFLRSAFGPGAPAL